MINFIITTVVSLLLGQIGTFQLNSPDGIIKNQTMPKQVEDLVFNQEAGGDISRQMSYPVLTNSNKIAPEISAKSALIIDAKSGLVLYDKNSKEQLAIASITKLMTSIVFLDQQALNPTLLSWDQEVEFLTEDVRPGRNYLGSGEKVLLKDVFSSLLVGSINSSAITLVRATGLSEVDFVKKMNAKALELNMDNTSFADPTGLDDNNVSTARDLAKLVYTAMKNEEITSRVKLLEYELKPLNKKVVHKILNTDWLLQDEWFLQTGYSFVGGKTGYTDKAGYSFASQFVDTQGNSVISVILNTDSVEKRFEETKEIVQWSFENFKF
jgi:D-alanyl-D-alanine carboxypeptidase